MVHDCTNQYQISHRGTGHNMTVQDSTEFPLLLYLQDCTGQYKAVQDFLYGTYQYNLVQTGTYKYVLVSTGTDLHNTAHLYFGLWPGPGSH
jgi:hypothetical protein